MKKKVLIETVASEDVSGGTGRWQSYTALLESLRKYCFPSFFPQGISLTSTKREMNYKRNKIILHL